MASMEIPTEAVVSVAVTIGFPNPPVVKEDAPLVIVVKPWTTPAAPPPAIIASVHFSNGSISTIEDAITTVPAITAVGPEIVSKRLSTKGIKYAPSSNKAAAVKTINAGSVPIHSNPLDKERWPVSEAKLIINRGTKILNPTAAARLMPNRTLNIVSKFVI